MTDKNEKPKWPKNLPQEPLGWEEGLTEYRLTEKDLESYEDVGDLLWDMEKNPDDRYAFLHDKSRPWPRLLKEAEDRGLLRSPKGENYYYRSPDNPNHFIQVTPDREKDHPTLQQVAATQRFSKVELVLTERAKRSIKEIRERHAEDRKAEILMAKTPGNVTNINIGKMGNLGVLGDVGSEAVVAIDQSRSFNDEQIGDLRSLLDQITRYQGELSMEGDQIAQIQETLEVVRQELDGGKPDAGKVRSALGSLRTILEGAAGNVIASGILTQLGKFG